MHVRSLALAVALMQSREAVVMPDNPCELLTVQQMAEATGLEVTEARRVPDIQEIVRAQEDGREPNPGIICSYETRSAFGAIIVAVPSPEEQTTAKYQERLERQRQHPGGSAQIVRGLALHAWTSGGTSISVLAHDNAHFSVSTQMYQRRSYDIVIAVARAVLGELERQQPVVKRPSSTETDEAPRWPGATTENIQPYLMEEQRRQRGCIVGRMPADVSPRAARDAAKVCLQLSPGYCDRTGAQSSVALSLRQP